VVSAVLVPLWAAPALAQQPAAQRQAQPLPAPDIANFKYGDHERNVLDLWKAHSDQPTPLVVFIHGGGFRAGDKSQLNPGLLRGLLTAGISVGAINYRLSQHAPFPAPMHDSAKAIQTYRAHAKEWNLDPARIGATGGSAGAGISLWLGFHDDLAKPDSDSPLARQSTRLTCMAVFGAQSSYDLRFIKKEIGGRAHEHPALLPFFGITADEVDSQKAHKLFEEASPITHVSKDDAPAFLFYNEPKGPLPDDARPGQGIHHPRFGEVLKKELDALGIECIVRHADDYKEGGPASGQNVNREIVEFFKKHLQARK
jgi:acetyl esterase/lipase